MLLMKEAYDVIVVVGGGDTAVEEALLLSKLASKVYLVHRDNALRAARLLQGRLAAERKIDVIPNTVITGIRGDGEKVGAVSIENTVTGAWGEIPTDGVFIFIGSVPNTSLVPAGVRKDEQGFVVTDGKCETTVPGIFAVGDLRRKFANQIVVAAADGSVAALAASHCVEAQKAAVLSS